MKNLLLLIALFALAFTACKEEPIKPMLTAEEELQEQIIGEWQSIYKILDVGIAPDTLYQSNCYTVTSELIGICSNGGQEYILKGDSIIYTNLPQIYNIIEVTESTLLMDLFNSDSPNINARFYFERN